MRFLTCYEVQDLKLIRGDLFPYLFPPEGQRFFFSFCRKEWPTCFYGQRIFYSNCFAKEFSLFNGTFTCNWSLIRLQVFYIVLSGNSDWQVCSLLHQQGESQLPKSKTHANTSSWNSANNSILFMQEGGHFQLLCCLKELGWTICGVGGEELFRSQSGLEQQSQQVQLVTHLPCAGYRANLLLFYLHFGNLSI